MKKLIIIPAYNEEKSLLSVIADIKDHAPDYDYVVINDASTDGTKALCEAHQIHFLDLASNLGIGGAVQTGYQYAFYEGYDLAVQMDGDGQHPAAALQKMETYLNMSGSGQDAGKADLVIGSRFLRKEGFQSTGARRIGIRYLSTLIRAVSGRKITDPTSGFRMCNRQVIRLFAGWYPWDYPEPETIVTVARSGFSIQEVPVLMRKRQGGKTSIGNPLKAIYYMIKVTAGILIETFGRRKQ